MKDGGVPLGVNDLLGRGGGPAGVVDGSSAIELESGLLDHASV